MDVGGFAEPRKILCLSVLTPPMSKDQFITGPRIPPQQFVGRFFLVEVTVPHQVLANAEIAGFWQTIQELNLLKTNNIATH